MKNFNSLYIQQFPDSKCTTIAIESILDFYAGVEKSGSYKVTDERDEFIARVVDGLAASAAFNAECLEEGLNSGIFADILPYMHDVMGMNI